MVLANIAPMEHRKPHRLLMKIEKIGDENPKASVK